MAIIKGNKLDNILNGTSANDTIAGLGGNDKLYGNTGNDSLYDGNDGNDWLDGGLGADLMRGGAGDDRYIVDNSGDKVEESANALNGIFDAVVSSVTFLMPTGIEQLLLSGSADIDAIGNDFDNTLTGNAGNNRLIGGGGSDSLYDHDVFSSADSSGDNDFLFGDAGDDYLSAGWGNDFLFGGEGDDYLFGGDGHTTMQGGTGDDSYFVTNRNNVISEQANAGNDSVTVAQGSYSLGKYLENLTLDDSKGITKGMGNALDNRITGSLGDNILIGGKGNDVLNGNVGNDILRGGDGDDQLLGGVFQYQQNPDGNNILYGGNGNDHLSVVVRDEHRIDHLTGGNGNDTFKFDFNFNVLDGLTNANFRSVAVITDFTSGQDSIDLSFAQILIDNVGVVPFTFINNQAFNASDASGQLRFDATNHLLLGSIDADSTAELSIKLTGIDTLSATDLIL